MTYYCILCDKTMKSLSKYEHFKSKTHTSFTNSKKRRYIIQNLDFHKVDNIKKYVNNHFKKYEEYDVHCLLNLLTTTNRVRYIRIKPPIKFLLYLSCS